MLPPGNLEFSLLLQGEEALSILRDCSLIQSKIIPSSVKRAAEDLCIRIARVQTLASISNLLVQMLELLLKAGSDINSRNIVGDAPLHKAALNGRALSADFLIRSGANVNIR